MGRTAISRKHDFGPSQKLTKKGRATMFYADHHCTYTEDYKNGHTYTFKGKCLNNGTFHSVTVQGSDLYKYRRGAYIQDAFPYLSSSDREFLMSGYTSLDFLDDDRNSDLPT